MGCLPSRLPVIFVLNGLSSVSFTSYICMTLYVGLFGSGGLFVKMGFGEGAYSRGGYSRVGA